MRRDKRVLLWCGMFICVILCTVLVHDTWAENCSDIVGANSNQSLVYACNAYGTRGAAWLSDASSEYSISDNITITQSEQELGKKKIYLHGSILCADEYCYDSRATYIWISKGEDRITSWEAYRDANWYGAISKGSLHDDGLLRYAVLSPWSNNIRSGVAELTLDINELIKLEQPYKTEGRKVYYRVPLQVYRCFEGGDPYYNTDEDGSCYSDTSYLNVVVEEAISVSFEGKLNMLGTSDTSQDWNEWVDQNKGWWRTTKWTDSADGYDPNISYEITDCGDGCYAQFRHYLWATVKGEKVPYRIKREITRNGDLVTNYLKGGENNYEEFTYSSTQFVARDVVRLNPGDKVCETLEFYANTARVAKKTLVACAIAEKTQPQGDTTTYEAKLNMTVKNNETGKEGKEIYAKPTDSLTYHVEYNPAPQMVYDVRTPKVIINNGEKEINEPGDKTAGELFNSWGGMTWKNDFCVSGGLLGTKCGEYDKGDSGEKDEYYSVNINGVVGKAFSDTAKTLDKDDFGSGGLVTPTRASVTKVNNAVTEVGVSTSPISSSVKVYIPYNFANTTEIDDSDRIVYAGEVSEVSYRISTGSRWNAVLGDEYKTAVGSIGKRKVRVCYDGNCTPGKVELIESWSNDGGLLTSTVPVGDLPAGTKVTIQSAVYPKDSFGDVNWNLSIENGWEDYCSSDYDECWAFSGEKEFIVAKRPSFQVWGGNLYSGSDIDAKSATKMTIAGGYSGDLPRTFGSWTELALVKGAGNDDMASGAGFGYTVDGWNGRIKNESYDTLTYDGGGGSDKKLELSYVEGLLGDDYEEYLNDGPFLFTGNVPSQNGKGTRKFLYAYDNSDSDAILIRQNIEVNRDGSYSSFEETPSVVIYATGNISINCEVKRIDAILIAGGTINTCGQDGSNHSFSEDDIRKRDVFAEQLVVNGALWAQRINFYRPVGARTGKESGEPAEIINYDSSFVIPGTGSVDVGRDETTLGNFVVEAVSELAPRY